jgi:hypothetical protein
MRSRWREFNFAFGRVLEAIAPRTRLLATLHQWNQIAADLGERSRRRIPQVQVGGIG